MSEWIAIESWPDCSSMERPGIVFELRNGEGQTLVSPCVATLPATPFDWTSAPVEFRPIDERPAEHSAPMPPPASEN